MNSLETGGRRAEMLSRLRSALANVMPGPVLVRKYRVYGEFAPGSLQALAQLMERLKDYGTTIHWCGPEDVERAVAKALGDSQSVAVPPGLHSTVLKAAAARNRTVLIDGDPELLTKRVLDQVDAAITTCALAISETGTLILDTGLGQGRRILTLLPDRHVCIVYADQVVQTVPEAMSHLNPTRPLTFVSGPSATSDIELKRVEGVHGPRNLHVVLVSDEQPLD